MRTIRIRGSVLAASVFVKSATLATEIPVLEAEGEQRYNGNCRRAEVLEG